MKYPIPPGQCRKIRQPFHPLKNRKEKFLYTLPISGTRLQLQASLLFYLFVNQSYCAFQRRDACNASVRHCEIRTGGRGFSFWEEKGVSPEVAHYEVLSGEISFRSCFPFSVIIYFCNGLLGLLGIKGFKSSSFKRGAKTVLLKCSLFLSDKCSCISFLFLGISQKAKTFKACIELAWYMLGACLVLAWCLRGTCGVLAGYRNFNSPVP